MSGFRRVEHDHGYGYIYDKEHKTPEQEMDELWDENIDYILALRKILSFYPSEGEYMGVIQLTAETVLRKHSKLEEQDEENTTDSDIDDNPAGL